jgi:O-antigen/teichoic acid export membrane protein
LAVAFASPIVTVWLGDGYDAVVPALQIISVGNYLSLLTGPAFMMSLGLGQPKIGVRFSLVLAGFTVLLSPILIPVFGYTGALWSYSASASVAAVYLLWSFHGENRLPSGKLYFANVALPAVLTAALAFGVQSLFDFSPDLGRWGTGIVLAQAAAVFFPLSLLLMWRIQLIGREEWSLICDAIRVPRLIAFVRR